MTAGPTTLYTALIDILCLFFKNNTNTSNGVKASFRKGLRCEEQFKVHVFILKINNISTLIKRQKQSFINLCWPDIKQLQVVHQFLKCFLLLLLNLFIFQILVKPHPKMSVTSARRKVFRHVNTKLRWNSTAEQPFRADGSSPGSIRMNQRCDRSFSLTFNPTETSSVRTGCLSSSSSSSGTNWMQRNVYLTKEQQGTKDSYSEIKANNGITEENTLEISRCLLLVSLGGKVALLTWSGRLFFMLRAAVVNAKYF